VLAAADARNHAMDSHDAYAQDVSTMMVFINSIQNENLPAPTPKSSHPGPTPHNCRVPKTQRGGGARLSRTALVRTVLQVESIGGVYQWTPKPGSVLGNRVQKFRHILQSLPRMTAVPAVPGDWCIAPAHGPLHPLLGVYAFHMEAEMFQRTRRMLFGEHSCDAKNLAKLLTYLGMTSDGTSTHTHFFVVSHWNKSGYRLAPGGHVGKGKTAPSIQVIGA
jgi:hypothetical protein